MLICDTPASVEAYRLLALKSMLSIEVKTGLKHSRGSPSKTIRSIIGSVTRSKEKLLKEYIQWLTTKGILQGDAYD